jgi:hypothetical protein
MGRSTTVEIGEAMSDELPVVFLTIEEVRRELRIWQERGLQGIPRYDAERDRVSQLWHAVDAECGRPRTRPKYKSFTEWLKDNPPPDLQKLAEPTVGSATCPRA